MADTVLLEERPAEQLPAEPVQPEAPKEKKKFRLTKYWIFLIVLIAVLAAIWGVFQMQSASDFWLNRVHPACADLIGSITAKFPVPIYEIMIAAAAVLGVLLIVFLILLIFLRKRAKYRRFVGGYFKTLLVIAVIAFGFSFIFDAWLLRSSVLGETDYTAREHTLEEVVALYDRWQTEVNGLIDKVDRDNNHHFIRRTEEEIRADLMKTRAKLSAEYGRFTIDPPPEKLSFVSPALHTFGIAAYTTTPTMEIVFSDRYEAAAVFPSVYAHEFSHYCGYWREDEANYLGFRLCDLSEDPNIRYAGYIDIRTDLRDAIDKAFFGDAPVDHSDEGYLALRNERVQFEDAEHIYLFVGDLDGNYTLYHELREEEDSTPPEPDYGTLPEGVGEIVSDAGEKHFENLRDKLGTHYYDGVVQLMLDHME